MTFSIKARRSMKECHSGVPNWQNLKRKKSILKRKYLF